MIINNKELSARIRLGFLFFVLVFMVIIVLALIFSWSEKLFEVKGNHKLELYAAIFFVLGVIFFFGRRYNYIYYNNEGSKIILRYMPLQPLLYGNYSIEIPKSQFVKFSVKTGLLGFRKSVILYQQTERGLSKYPPVSIATLSKTERLDLLESLSKHQKTKE